MAERGPTRRAAVLGSPISHSLSPALHRAAYAALGLNWHYEAIEVDEAGLPAFLAGLDGSWAGLSLTMPLKEAVIELLAEIDEVAAATNAVNTVLPSSNGWRGTNTDVYGIVAALTHAGLPAAPTVGLILGAGATARSAVAAMAQLGVRRLLISARRPAAAESLLPVAGAFGLDAALVDWTCGSSAPTRDLQHLQVTVSTVPGDAGAAWQTFGRRSTGALLDASYHPWPTPLSGAWAGSVIASGRQMLLWQAVEQVHLMTGMPPPVQAMAAALPPASLAR